MESIRLDLLVKAPELALRRVALLFPLVVLLLSAFSLFRPLFGWSVDPAVLPLLIFILVVFVLPFLPTVFGLMAVLTLRTFNFAFKLLALGQRARINGFHVQLG